ncbi:ABC transporter substrate-binding protein [Phenylobacterium sp.]|uniref:ABC transporter substrate-binding protein n=1 Tax=Phenylobacterium sp. TaxID=1871053 RepID=UPI00286B741D|nr:ABC transporter substrate-binding protein [Phenylobacterium sp.]
MRRAVRSLVIGVVAAALAAPALARAPHRILSMNLCADLLLLQLAPRARIVSVSHLAHEGAQTLFPGRDAGIAINHGAAEDIVNLKPDLILVGDTSTPMTRALARRVGARVVEVKSANSLAEARAIILRLGDDIAERPRAASLVARFDLTLAALAARPAQRRPRVIAWSGGAFVPGAGSLIDDIIAKAGADNLAARPGGAGSAFDVEALIAARPDALLYGAERSGPPSLHNAQSQHRLVRRLYARRSIAYNDVAATCGLPQSADAARDLRAALDRLPTRSLTP